LTADSLAVRSEPLRKSSTEYQPWVLLVLRTRACATFQKAPRLADRGALRGVNAAAMDERAISILPKFQPIRSGTESKECVPGYDRHDGAQNARFLRARVFELTFTLLGQSVIPEL
jgi:hypothetical protein